MYLAIASDGIYSAGSAQADDFAAPCLRWTLRFLGMSDMTGARA